MGAEGLRVREIMTPTQSGIQRRESDASLLLLMLVVYFIFEPDQAVTRDKKGVGHGGKEFFFS